ncbi:MAG TPA: hypothetical protein DEF05_07615 [Erwinia sp.]|uniref:hypothetical protein n=1 Tax=Erwinia citreus TaxID=558 RepID=UPI000E9CAB34|nr:hypothetical protein [Erwinia sp.]HBV39542.1 hypothetical protein [Erwinia sp.]
MSTIFKISYEHQASGHLQAAEVLLESEGEPTQEAVQDAVRKDLAKHADTADFSVVSVAPYP